MTGRRVAILHHARSFFPLDLRRAIGDEIEPLWVLVDACSHDLAMCRLLRRLGPVVDIADLDADAAAQRMAAHRPEGIVTFVDDNLVLAAELAARLGLPYHSPEVARTLANKRLQRRTLDAAGVPGPTFWELTPAMDAGVLAELAHRIGYPAVLKPSDGSGSRGIMSLEGPDDLLAWHPPGTDALVEEYLDDDPERDARFASYLSLESVVSRGAISHVAMCGRFPLASPFRETGNFIPAAVAPGPQAALFEVADAAVRALGITIGVMHIEIKLTPSGPRLIEINGRLGGRPPFVLRSVSDVNLFRVACDLALGEHVTYPGLVPCDGVGYWRMIQPPQPALGIREVRGLDVLSAAGHVDDVRLNRRPGDSADWREGTDGVVVTVRGRVRDHDELADAIAFIDRSVEVDYELDEALHLAGAQGAS